jgi:hypothetical protein
MFSQRRAYAQQMTAITGDELCKDCFRGVKRWRLHPKTGFAEALVFPPPPPPSNRKRPSPTDDSRQFTTNEEHGGNKRRRLDVEATNSSSSDNHLQPGPSKKPRTAAGNALSNPTASINGNVSGTKGKVQQLLPFAPQPNTTTNRTSAVIGQTGKLKMVFANNNSHATTPKPSQS